MKYRRFWGRVTVVQSLARGLKVGRSIFAHGSFFVRVVTLAELYHPNVIARGDYLIIFNKRSVFVRSPFIEHADQYKHTTNASILMTTTGNVVFSHPTNTNDTNEVI